MLIIIVDAFVQKVECFAKIKMPMRKTEEKNRRKTLLLLKISIVVVVNPSLLLQS